MKRDSGTSRLEEIPELMSTDFPESCLASGWGRGDPDFGQHKPPGIRLTSRDSPVNLL